MISVQTSKDPRRCCSLMMPFTGEEQLKARLIEVGLRMAQERADSDFPIEDVTWECKPHFHPRPEVNYLCVSWKQRRNAK